MTIQQHLNESFRNYSTLYGNNRLKVLDQLLLTNGNGMDWTRDGTIENCCRPRLGKDKKESRKEIHKKGMSILETLPPATELRVREILPCHEGMIWGMPAEHKTEADAWYDWKMPEETDTYIKMYLDSLAKPARFHDVHTRTFSAIAKIPGNAQPDYVAAAQEVLLAVLDHRETEHSNHANAIILLLRHQPLFRKHGIPIKTKTVLERLEQTHRRLLELDCKRHRRNHELDEALLSDAEFFEYNRLSTWKLNPSEIKLVRRYRQYLDWKEEHQQKLRVEQNRKDRERQSEFWEHIQIKGSAVSVKKLPESTLNWTKGKKSMADMFRRIRSRTES